MFRFDISGRTIIPRALDILVAGSDNYQCSFSFSPEWEQFTKIVMFKAGCAYEETMYNTGSTISIPEEILALPDKDIYVACCGFSNGQIIFSTEWKYIGTVRLGPACSSAPGLNGELLAQVMSSIGDLGNLSTNAKSSLVSAINEVYSSASQALTEIPTKVSQLENDEDFINRNYVDTTVGSINALLSII